MLLPKVVVNAHNGHGPRLGAFVAGSSKARAKQVDWSSVCQRIQNGHGTPRSVFIELQSRGVAVDIQTVRNYVAREIRKNNEELAAWADKHFTGPGGSFTTTDFDLLMAAHAKDKRIAVVALLREGVGRSGHIDAGRHGPAVIVVKFPGDDQGFYTLPESALHAATNPTVSTGTL